MIAAWAVLKLTGLCTFNLCRTACNFSHGKLMIVFADFSYVDMQMAENGANYGFKLW
jgi:hypothetical protein